MIRFYQEIWQHRDLIKYMVAGQQKSAVFRSVLGSLWYVIVPLAQTGIYYFLVAVVFASGGVRASPTFILIMMGILHYALLYHIAGFMQPAIHGNASLLLQVKLEPILLVAAGFARAVRVWIVGIIIYFVFFFVLGEKLTIKAAAYPFLLVLFIIMAWLIGLLAATIAVFIRDFDRLLPILLQIVMYASPVIYAVKFYPERYESLLLINPIAAIFALFQWSILGAAIDVSFAVSVVVVWIIAGFVFAHLIYKWGRRHFTKVL